MWTQLGMGYGVRDVLHIFFRDAVWYAVYPHIYRRVQYGILIHGGGTETADHTPSEIWKEFKRVISSLILR